MGQRPQRTCPRTSAPDSGLGWLTQALPDQPAKASALPDQPAKASAQRRTRPDERARTSLDIIQPPTDGPLVVWASPAVRTASPISLGST